MGGGCRGRGDRGVVRMCEGDGKGVRVRIMVRMCDGDGEGGRIVMSM